MKKRRPNKQHWLDQQRKTVLDYLAHQHVKHGAVAPKPDWLLAPYVSIWRIESTKQKGRVGFWAIAGDCPTDYLSGNDAADARAAVRAFGKQWKEAALLMQRGQEHPTFRVGPPEKRKELGALLLPRAKCLLEFADDDELW